MRPTLGDQQRPGATGHPLLPRRPPPPPPLSPRAQRGAARTPSLPPAQPKFPVLGRAEQRLRGPQRVALGSGRLQHLAFKTGFCKLASKVCHSDVSVPLITCWTLTGKQPQVCVMGTQLWFKDLVSSSKNTLNLSLRGFWRMAQRWLGRQKVVPLCVMCARVHKWRYTYLLT